MIQWVIEGVSQSQIINKIIVATDHQEIARTVENLGVEVKMTDSELPSGSDRVWQATKDISENLVINIQGDEPLIQGPLLDEMAKFMTTESDWDVVTFGRPMPKDNLANENVAKIVLDQRDYALYFSRLPIPYSRRLAEGDAEACLKHIGIYGYKKDFLEKFCAEDVTPIEYFEGLEQLRALYLGGKIKVLKVNYESWGVDIPDDIPEVENRLRKLYG